MRTLKGNLIIYFFTALALLLLTFTSCKDDDDDDDQDIRRATVTLTGAKEVPANSSDGTGTAQIDYNVTNRTISYRIDWSLGSLTAITNGMHFHGAENGTETTNSPVVIPITGFSPLYTGSISGTTRQLTAEESAQLLDGKWYVNIHSSDYPDGEIRGTIKF